jgi:hypothetical protein
VAVRAAYQARTPWPALPIWNPGLPQMPGDLLERAVFGLTTDEAQFLIDRLVASQRSALLTILAREGIDADCRFQGGRSVLRAGRAAIPALALFDITQNQADEVSQQRGAEGDDVGIRQRLANVHRAEQLV